MNSCYATRETDKSPLRLLWSFCKKNFDVNHISSSIHIWFQTIQHGRQTTPKAQRHNLSRVGVGWLTTTVSERGQQQAACSKPTLATLGVKSHAASGADSGGLRCFLIAEREKKRKEQRITNKRVLIICIPHIRASVWSSPWCCDRLTSRHHGITAAVGASSAAHGLVGFYSVSRRLRLGW